MSMAFRIFGFVAQIAAVVALVYWRMDIATYFMAIAATTYAYWAAYGE